MFDVIIKGGKIIDGTGGDAYVADLGIRGERIEAIGNLADAEAKMVIDGAGLTVTPGFIDAHSHGDGTILLYPNAESAVRQGITTFVGGQCGDSPAPRSDKYYMRHFWEYDAWYEIDHHTFYADFVQPKQKALEVLEPRYNVKFDFSTFDGYLSKLENMGISANFVPLLGHGTIRAHSMGPKDANRIPSADEMKQMKAYLKDAMESGAWGISTGLDYVPSAYAKTPEIVELVRELKPYDAYYNTHWRKTGLRMKVPGHHYAIDGIREACEIGLQTGVKTQLSHLSSGYSIAPMPDPELDAAAARATLRVFDAYREQGAQLAFDVIPNTSGGFQCIPYLVMYFVPWVRMSGGVEHFIENLQSFDYREEFHEYIMSGKWYMVSPVRNAEWDKIIYVTCAKDASLAGKSLREITQERGGSNSVDTVIDLLIEDPLIKVMQNRHIEGSVQEFLNHESAMGCIDSYVYDDVGPFGVGQVVPEILPHPNAYCGFIKYIKAFGQPRLEDTIRKITGVTAQWLGMEKRGTLKEGNFADVVVFDEKTLEPNENHIEPRQKPKGIRFVFVNGKLTVQDGEHTGARSGAVLRFNKKELFR